MLSPKFAAVLSTLALTVLGTAASSTFAAVVTYSDTLTVNSPTFNRPLTGTPPTGLSAVGTNVYYDLQPFTVDVSGPYNLETTAAALTPGAADDTFIVLYAPTVVPATPLVNALAADDDAGPGGLSLITGYNLTAGTPYSLLVTTFSNLTTGSFTASISGPGTASFPGIPEPTTLTLLGAGALALTARRRRA